MIRVVLVFAALLVVFTVVPNAASAADHTPDAQITDRVKRLLRADFRVRDDSIEVTASNGWVTLKGDVTSVLDRHQAEQLAKKVAGVQGVRNLIQIRSPIQRDDDIAAEVRQKLSQHAGLRSLEITASVKNGVVTLSGEVESLATSRLAEQAARQVRGVRLVRTQWIYASGNRSDENIESDVRAELDRDMLLAEMPIEVVVSAGVVSLTGDVNSLFQKDRAEEESRLIDGVKDVRNRIELRPQVIFRELGRPPNDDEIRRMVSAELATDPRVSAADITVTAQDRCVTLRGSVPSLYEKQFVQRIVRSVIGVVQIDNRLNVTGEDRADDEIRSDIEASLASDSLLYGQRITVSVHQGVATLSGEVKDFNSKFQASRIASRIRGVRSLTNETKVSPSARIGDDEITRLLARWLRANAVTRSVAERIHVRTEDGVVTLTGEVLTWSQRAEAGNAALFIDGARRVDNQLTVAEPDR